MMSLRVLKSAASQTVHKPVLLEEVMRFVAPSEGVIVDATFGGGGYSTEFIKKTSGRIYAIDRDPQAIIRGKELEQEFPDRFSIRKSCFSALSNSLEFLKGACDVVVMDIGVSSDQLHEGERGFSFSRSGPLDMRMNQEGTTASDVINTFTEEELRALFLTYGEEKHSRIIAKRIVEERAKTPLKTTDQLRDIIHAVSRKGYHKIDPSTKVFQALRIYVNDELSELKKGIQQAHVLLKEGGRLLIVSFHSLEDRIVKQAFTPPLTSSRYRPENMAAPSLWKVITRRPVVPGEEEALNNPRSRSAKLRVASKASHG